jgi:hypothetical protein
LFQNFRGTIQLTGHASQLTRGFLAGHLVLRCGPRHPDRVRDTLESALSAPARFMQLVKQGQEDIQLAHRAQAAGHLAEPALEFAGRVVVELKHGQQLAEPARRDPRAMDRAHVPFFDTGQHPCKPVDAGFQEIVTSSGWRHDMRTKP